MENKGFMDEVPIARLKASRVVKFNRIHFLVSLYLFVQSAIFLFSGPKDFPGWLNPVSLNKSVLISL